MQMQQCQGWVEGSILSHAGDFCGVATDSRSLKPGSLFVALVGDTFDAHNFLHEVAAAGAAALVVAHNTDPAKLAGISIPVLRVQDTKSSLCQIARGYRTQFTCPVIGVTGSNGKTTVKEMIAAILQAAHPSNYLATRGNLNNDIGVPLTVLRMDAMTQVAVVELGMNHPGEIEFLSSIAMPTVGLVNNAQREHQEFMESVHAVAVENGAVIRSLPKNGSAVFPADDPYTSLWEGYAAEAGVTDVVTFGLRNNASVWGDYVAGDFGCKLTVHTRQGDFVVELSAAGEHNVLNALAAVACALAAGIGLDAVAQGLAAFSPVAGRMQRKASQNGMLVIDDTYNANPDSVRAAIDVLARIDKCGKRILVLGDMGEVGDQGPAFHAEIGKYAADKKIDVVLTMGDLARATTERFGCARWHCATREELHSALVEHLDSKAAVLIKGSRFMKMEQTVQFALQHPA